MDASILCRQKSRPIWPAEGGLRPQAKENCKVEPAAQAFSVECTSRLSLFDLHCMGCLNSTGSIQHKMQSSFVTNKLPGGRANQSAAKYMPAASASLEADCQPLSLCSSDPTAVAMAGHQGHGIQDSQVKGPNVEPEQTIAGDRRPLLRICHCF